MPDAQTIRIKTITEYHRLAGLPSPQHPLISLVHLEDIKNPPVGPITLALDFYSISVKRVPEAQYKYGQHTYDFDEGVMFFMAPGQVFRLDIDKMTVPPSGWIIFIHPDFLWKTSLAKTIRQYEYFGYAVTEALYLSEKEEALIKGIAQHIEQEYHANIDNFSQSVIIAQLELLLTYADRFYQRQFITRKIANHEVLERVEELLTKYFNSDALARQGMPTVQYVAESLHMSPGYLSGLLRGMTGQSTQQHIHDKLIDKAKEKLSATRLSVSEIAYELGFGYPQSFSKLFKTKTNLSPLEFRRSFG